MGDMGETFRAVREGQREKKNKRLEHFEQVGLAELCYYVGESIVRHTPYHYSFDLQEYRVDYWPSTGRWRWGNRYYYGGFDSFLGFVKKRLPQ